MPPAALDPQRPAVSIDGIERPELGAGLVELTVEDSFVGDSFCRATFVNWGHRADGSTGFLHFEPNTFDSGRFLRVAPPLHAPSAAPGPGLFEGRVRGLEGSFGGGQLPRVTALALPRSHEFRAMPRTRQTARLTDADAIALIAADNGLHLTVELATAPRPAPAQSGTSDLDYLLRRARALGAELWLAGNHLFFVSAKLRAAPEVTLTVGEDLVEFTGTWNVAARERVTNGIHPFVVATGVVSGFEPMYAGQRVRVQGAGPLLQGIYYLTRAVHRFDPSAGLTCRFDAELVAR